MGLPVWTVVYVASGAKEAENVKSRLAKEGLLAMIRPCGCQEGKATRHFELLVPEAEARDAQTIIMQFLGTVRA